MATVSVSTTAELLTAITNSAGGDIIELEDGSYSPLSRTTAVTRSPRVTIRPKNRNKAVFETLSASDQGNCMWRMQGWNGFNIEGLVFSGYKNHKYLENGVYYPNGGSRAVKMHLCSNITFKDNLVDFMDIGFEAGSGSASDVYMNNIEYAYNETMRMGMDCYRIYNATNGYHVHHCYNHSPQVNRNNKKHYAGGRHCDFIQGAIQYQDPPTRNVVIEDNWSEFLTGPDGYNHSIFFLNDRTEKQGSSGGDIYYENMTIRRNYVLAGHTNAIAFSGARGTLICRDNCMATPSNGYDSLPTLNVYRQVGTSASKLQVANNVRGRDLGKGNNVASKDANNLQYVNVSTVEPDIIAANATARPVGWATWGPVPPGVTGVAATVGRYAYETEPVEVAPVSPTIGGAPALPIGTPAVTTATGTSVAVTMPSGVLAGEMILVEVAADGNPTITVDTTPSGDGWTKQGQASQSTNVTGAVFYKANAAGAGGDALTLTLSASEEVTARATRITGHGGTVYGALAATTGANSNPPSLTPGGGLKDYTFRAIRAGDGAAVATAAPTGFTGLASTSSTVSLSVAMRPYRGTVLDPGAFTSASANAVAGTIAIPPTTGDRANYHGRVDNYYDAGLIDWLGDGVMVQAYGPVIIIPTTSPATAAEADDIVVQWRAPTTTGGDNPAVANAKPTRAATPSKNAAGGLRYEARPDFTTYNATYPNAHRSCFVRADETFVGLEWRYRLATGTLWSEWTPYTSGFDAPTTIVPASVTSAAIANTAYTVGQTATVNFDYALGSGTFTSLKVEWYLGATLVETDSGLTNGTKTATYTTTAAGSLTAKVTLVTSGNTATRTSAAAAVAATPVAPSVTSISITPAVLAVGNVATATFACAFGSGTFTSLKVEWYLGATLVETDNLASTATSATYTTTAAGSLTAKVTLVTSVGSANLTSSAVTVSSGVVSPDVTSVAHGDASYTTGQSATANFDYTLGSGAFQNLTCRWFMSGVTPAPKPLPAFDPDMAALASAAGDYRCNTTTEEGSATAYHGLCAELVGYEVARGNAAHRARLAAQCRRWLTAGGDPTGKGGLATQYDIHVADCILAAKLAPGGWWTTEFTATERAKLSLLMEGMAYGAAFSGSASANSSVNLTGAQNQPKNTPNWRTSIPATLWAWAAFRGGYGTPDFAGVLSALGSFSKSAFYASCVANDLDNMAETFRERGGSTGLSGPTNTAVEAALDNWKFIARTGSTHWDLDDVDGIIVAELEFGFSNTIESGLNGGAGVTYNGVQRGLMMKNAARLPNIGQTGMLHQLNTTDGGGANSSLNNRSAISYAVRNYFNEANLLLTAIIGGIIDPSTIAGVSALADRCGRGVTDLEVKSREGYLSFSKGGGVSNNEDWLEGTTLANAHRMPVQIAAWRDIIDPWLRSSDQIAVARVASGVKTASRPLPAGKSGTLTAQVSIATLDGDTTLTDSMTSGTATVGAAAVAPTVASITLSPASAVVGQAVTATLDYALGSGTFTSLKVEWFRGGTLVETDTLASGVKTASRTTTAAGSLTAKVTLITSVGSVDLTSSAVTINPAPVAPVMGTPLFDKSAYVVGETATLSWDFTAGNGSFTSLVAEFLLNGTVVKTESLAQAVRSTTYLIPADGTLTGRVTVTTSAGSSAKTTSAAPISSPAPLAPDADDWAFISVVAAAGFSERFTARLVFPVGSSVADSAVIGVDWTGDGGTTWRHCIQRGTNVDGRKVWELGPSAAAGDSAHTVYYQETSASIRVRISTATGTSGISPAPGQQFVGPLAPPVEPEEPEAPDAPGPDDWSLTVTPAPGYAGRFTGLIAFGAAIDDADVLTVDWLGLDGAWRPTSFAGVDANGERTWRMSSDAGVEHVIEYGQTLPNIAIRYSVAEGLSPASTDTKAITAPAAPGGEYLGPGEALARNGVVVVMAGLPVRIAQDVRPSLTPDLVEVSDDDGILSMVLPILPATATAWIVSYAGRHQALTSGDTWQAPRLAGQSVIVFTAYDSSLRGSVSRFAFAPPEDGS